MPSIIVCALYHFVTLDDLPSLQTRLRALMAEHGIKGTLLLAHEGINGTVAAKREGIDALMHWLRSDERFQDISAKESHAEQMPFLRSKVKLKKEIVTMGVEDIDPARHAGTYVAPQDWNALIADPDVIVVDTRNKYEVAIGSFEGAVNPETDSFREFPEFVADKLANAKKAKVAMFCTGGIRCEKSTAYLKQQGFDEVYHLQGGILKYLEDVPQEESRWQGECFVFDGRVSVKHGLELGEYGQCHACRMPLSVDEQAHPHFTHGISCHHCYDVTTAEQKRRYADREQQIQRATANNEPHMGDCVAQIAEQRRQQKRRHAEQSSAASQGLPHNTTQPGANQPGKA